MAQRRCGSGPPLARSLKNCLHESRRPAAEAQKLFRFLAIDAGEGGERGDLEAGKVKGSHYRRRR
jgi:hypothetical protein